MDTMDAQYVFSDARLSLLIVRMLTTNSEIMGSGERQCVVLVNQRVLTAIV